MYSQLTTGRKTHVRSKIATETQRPSSTSVLTRKNKATKTNEGRELWELPNGEMKNTGWNHLPDEGKYQRGRQSVYQYSHDQHRQPSRDITFEDPDGEVHHWPQVTERLPRKVESIKPHPHGIHLGTLQRMCSESTDSA